MGRRELWGALCGAAPAWTCGGGALGFFGRACQSAVAFSHSPLDLAVAICFVPSSCWSVRTMPFSLLIPGAFTSQLGFRRFPIFQRSFSRVMAALSVGTWFLRIASLTTCRSSSGDRNSGRSTSTMVFPSPGVLDPAVLHDLLVRTLEADDASPSLSQKSSFVPSVLNEYQSCLRVGSVEAIKVCASFLCLNASRILFVPSYCRYGRSCS